MASSNGQFLSVTSGHVDNLIDYVLDVKPYHTKLSQIVEEFLFVEGIRVGIVDQNYVTAFLGADILPRTRSVSSRARRSKSWVRDEISDGSRRIFPCPLTVTPKKLSHLNQHRFAAGVDDDTQIPGLVLGAYSQRNWEFSAPHTVKVNSLAAAESIDYHQSYGVFSVQILPDRTWQQLNLSGIPGGDDSDGVRWNDSISKKFLPLNGALRYDDVHRSFGSIVDISGISYEEWILECIEENIPTLRVSGSSSGILGAVNIGNTFTSGLINFTFTSAQGEVGETISLGQKFVLTPAGKIVVAPDAPEEQWSIIKTNPHALVEAPVYTRAGLKVDSPNIQVRTKSLEFCRPSTWSVRFRANGEYVVNAITQIGIEPITGYPRTANLIDGCTYKDENVEFTLLPDSSGFLNGDRIDFTVKQEKENFLVFGSISGFQQPATIDRWYWNGKIGFKIPSLKYFAKAFNATIITSINADVGSWGTVVSNPQILNSIAHVSGSFLVSGQDSIVGKSLDGYSWSSDLTGLTNAGDTYVVIGDTGKIVTSTDGASWYLRNSQTNQNLNASTFIPNLLSPIGTVDESSPQAETLNSIIVVGDRGTIRTSINGIGWAIRDSGTSNNLNDVAWSQDGIIVVGSNGTILKSVDRITWTPVSIDINEFPGRAFHNLNAVIYEESQNVFIAVGDNGTILRSSNGGVTWVRPALPAGFDRQLNAIAFGNSRFVAVGRGGFTVTSDDFGASWQGYESARLNDIAFGAGVFSAVGGKRAESTLFIENKPVSSVAVPSVYTITFVATGEISTASAITATVHSNIDGYKRGLVLDEIWEDEYCSFKISSGGGSITYLPGDVIQVHLAPSHIVAIKNGYDVISYDDSLYDVSIADIELPIIYGEELYPLYHSHGTVILPAIEAGDNVIIDKCVTDIIRFKLEDAGVYYRELASEGDWIPLEFRYFDRVVNGVVTSGTGNYDLATSIEAYLSADPSVRVFSVAQPRYAKTDITASAVLTFDPVFFEKYIKFNTKFSLQFMPTEVWSQKIRVKISENMTTYAKIRLNFSDITSVTVVEDMGSWDIFARIDFIDPVNISFTEGGAFPFGGYDVLPYDVFAYDTMLKGGYVYGVLESPAGSGNYVYTGNSLDWIQPSAVIGSPAISVYQDATIDPAQASINESFSIFEREVGSTDIDIVNLIYNADYHTPLGGLLVTQEAFKYVVTHNLTGSTPTVIVESVANPGVFTNPVPSTDHYTGAQSFNSISFTVPAGTGPFKLILV